jgi:hypothetical protein
MSWLTLEYVLDLRYYLLTVLLIGQIQVPRTWFGEGLGWLRQACAGDPFEAPDPSTLEKFLGTIPMVFNVVILSPHGYFAQANVLGYPDTGGQVKPCILFAQIHGHTTKLSLIDLCAMIPYRLSTFWIKSELWRMRCFWGSSSKASTSHHGSLL